MNSLNQILTYDAFLEEIAAGGGVDNTPFEPLDIEYSSVTPVGSGKPSSRSPARRALLRVLEECDDSQTPRVLTGNRSHRGQHSLLVCPHPVSACAGSHYDLQTSVVPQARKKEAALVTGREEYISAHPLPYQENTAHDDPEDEEESRVNPIAPGLFPLMEINNQHRFMTFDVLPLNPTHVE